MLPEEGLAYDSDLMSCMEQAGSEGDESRSIGARGKQCQVPSSQTSSSGVFQIEHGPCAPKAAVVLDAELS